jgi:hypothetical protein
VQLLLIQVHPVIKPSGWVNGHKNSLLKKYIRLRCTDELDEVENFTAGLGWAVVLFAKGKMKIYLTALTNIVSRAYTTVNVVGGVTDKQDLLPKQVFTSLSLEPQSVFYHIYCFDKKLFSAANGFCVYIETIRKSFTA